MASGTITRLVTGRGFGFIQQDGGDEYFFHASAVQKPTTFASLNEGQKVTFETGNGPKGPRAEHVQID